MCGVLSSHGPFMPDRLHLIEIGTLLSVLKSLIALPQYITYLIWLAGVDYHQITIVGKRVSICSPNV
jgi:hypothetical protein